MKKDVAMMKMDKMCAGMMKHDGGMMKGDTMKKDDSMKQNMPSEPMKK